MHTHSHVGAVTKDFQNNIPSYACSFRKGINGLNFQL